MTQSRMAAQRPCRQPGGWVCSSNAFQKLFIRFVKLYLSNPWLKIWYIWRATNIILVILHPGLETATADFRSAWVFSQSGIDFSTIIKKVWEYIFVYFVTSSRLGRAVKLWKYPPALWTKPCESFTNEVFKTFTFINKIIFSRVLILEIFMSFIIILLIHFNFFLESAKRFHMWRR